MQYTIFVFLVLQPRQMQGVYANANEINLFLMIFPTLVTIPSQAQFNTENMKIADVSLA